MKILTLEPFHKTILLIILKRNKVIEKETIKAFLKVPYRKIAKNK